MLCDLNDLDLMKVKSSQRLSALQTQLIIVNHFENEDVMNLQKHLEHAV